MNYYFLGIGGIGMSAIARYLHQRGESVSGYDRTESKLTKALEQEGISIHYTDDPSLIPNNIDIVVYTPAVPQSMEEWKHIENLGVPVKKRSEMLGELTRNKKCIAVAGSHGKTTTSSMIAHLLNKSGIGCNAFLGGICKNYNSNMLFNEDSEYVVVEADEYDRSFLHLTPYISIITSTDPDHLDIYGTYENMLDAFATYASQTKPDGKLILKQNLPIAENIDRSHLTYTESGIEADFYPWNVRNYRGNMFFDLRTPNGVIYDIELPNSCPYNVENAVAAASAAIMCGLNEYQLRDGFKSYKGVERRFDYRINRKDLVFIDDYAHHPKEIATVLSSIKYLFPGKRTVGIFQPHLYSRTAHFADEFAKELLALDEIILLDIYPAREKPIPGVTSHMILHKIDKMAKYLCSKEQLPDIVQALYPEVLVTLGAGDIDRLVPELEKTMSEE